jgi:hypothetical protein
MFSPTRLYCAVMYGTPGQAEEIWRTRQANVVADRVDLLPRRVNGGEFDPETEMEVSSAI